MLLYNVRKNKEVYLFIVGLFFMCLQSCGKKENEKLLVIPFQIQMQSKFDNDLSKAISYLDSILINVNASEQFYKKSRAEFKKIEPVLSFLDLDNYGYLNQPNILKIEEEDLTDIKIKYPGGYQVLEEEIFTSHPDVNKIILHAKSTRNRLQLIKNNIRFEHLKPYHFLWMLRKAIIRVALTGVTGFDSPVLENSLEESRVVYQSLQEYIKIFQPKFQNHSLYNKWNDQLIETQHILSGDFNSFDRYHFIKNYIHPQLVLWNQTTTDWKATFPFELAIKNDAVSLFSTNTFNLNYFSDRNWGALTDEKIALGKRLFYDTNLSESKTISCGTCHQPEKAFTDGLKISKGTTRNSPTLLYASLQQAFFYDKRAGSLEGQIVSVVENANEFHTNLKALEQVVQNDSSYIQAFNEAYQKETIQNSDIRNAMANYIRSLTPFESKFDKNMNNQETSITHEEINGFNLFMGKAKCATCHFPPLFNGTVPPDYRETEIELIGVPQQNDTVHAVISKDMGRYNVYETSERKHFFKTSTVRNISKTSPYMHNGVYTTLEEVMDFYNRGGGYGIGIEQKYQTLPTNRLNLSDKEIADIIMFMQSLEDNTSY